jgi:hypothetical protein
MHLILGTAPWRHEQWQNSQPGHHVRGDGISTKSPFGRIPGIPLHSATRQLVGSLHPDNIDLLEPAGSKVECLIVSRCSTPTVASALLAAETTLADGSENDRPWDLFWVLVVVWQDGIAERRGVAQVLASALEMAVEPGPEVKSVLLG